MRALLVILALGFATAPAFADRGVFPDDVIPYGPDVNEGGSELSNILYVNRCADGCDYTSGSANNALTNETSLPEGPDGTTFTINAFGHGDALWEELMSCIRQVYGPYNVVVTDVDPGNVPHHEAIAAGTSADFGLPSDILGRAPGGCEARNNVISASFLNMYPASQVDEMCATIAQESAHSFGLPDHLYDCTDPMTYLAQQGQCGRKFFRNKLEPCGEFDGVIECACAGTRVNPHVILLGTFGPGEDPPPPVASITYPTDGGTITGNSIVQVAATDDRGVYQIDVFLNDWLWGTYQLPDSITPPFTFPTSITVEIDDGYPDGVIDVRARAYNDLGIFDDTETVTVMKGAACTSAASCLDGQECENGRCFWSEPTGALGDECTYDQFCEGPNTYDGRCESVGGSNICTQACFSGVNDNCPEGFACDSGSSVCAPDTGGGGCCSTGADGGAQIPLFIAALLGGVAVLRRRRRA